MTDVLSKERRFLNYMIISATSLNTPANPCERHNRTNPCERHNSATPSERHNTTRLSVHARNLLVIIKTWLESVISSRTLSLNEALLEYTHKREDKLKVEPSSKTSVTLISYAMGPET